MNKIYLCGPTVYSDIHIGNLRPVISLDFYIRALKLNNEKYFYLQNITDIDDKIINAANEKRTKEKAIASTYKNKYIEILQKINILFPQKMPSVVSNIKHIINFIKKIISAKSAYVSEGNVYFSISSAKDYGVISNTNISKNLRMEKTKSKKNYLDFVLWKKTSNGKSFDSPWSKGRPGWHTECSAIIDYYFSSRTLDLHVGGKDLIFPHHENENIQFLAKNKVSISKNWKHIGLVNFKGQKMAKSSGNLFLAKDFFKKYSPDLLRLIYLNSVPTAPLDISDNLLKQSTILLTKLQRLFNHILLTEKIKPNAFEKNFMYKKEIILHLKKWQFAKVMQIIFNLVKKINSKKSTPEEKISLLNILRTLGFLFANKKRISIRDKLLIKCHKRLLKHKKYKRADKIRLILFEKRLI